MLSNELPLKGIKVIDFTHFLAGPYLSKCLAGFGAEVIKIERPQNGDPGRDHPYIKEGYSGYYLQQNSGKKGVCVNLKSTEGKEFLKNLISTADVLVENYRPGALKKLGFGYEELSEINPSLIYCSISAYGHSGPDRQKSGFGVIAEARSGAMAQLGYPDQPPPLLRMPIADMYTGIHGVAAVCAALLGRLNNNKGQHIDMALYDCMVTMHDFAIQSYSLSNGQVIPQRTGSNLPQSTLYGVFACQNNYLVIAAQTDDLWQKLAHIVGGDSLAKDTRFKNSDTRNENNEEAVRLVNKWVKSQLSREKCLMILEGNDIPCAPVNNIDEVVSDEQTIARNLLFEQRHPKLGNISLLNLPFKFSSYDVTPANPAPKIGEHNIAIAKEIGLSEEKIQRYYKEGIFFEEGQE